MGKYDKFYESYYKKLNSSSDEKNANFYYDENRYNESRYVSSYSKKQKKSSKIGMLIFVSVLAFGGFGVYKFSQTKMGEDLYNTFLKAVSSVELVSNEKKNNEELKIDNQGEDLASPVFNQESEKTIKSDKKYSDLVSALSGVKIKAKSEQGLVLSCKYKIIATSLSGIVEEIGENAEGHFLILDHGNNIKTAYYNLPKVDFLNGEAIKKGEKITEIKEERDIVFKIKENDEFIAPMRYLDFIE